MTTTELPPTDAPASPRPERPAIDPRIRARRIAVRREEGRRRLHRLLRLSILLGAVVAGWLATRSPLLDVDHLEVRGAEHAAPDAIREATGIDAGDPMTDVETGAAAEGVEAVPWVATAEVARRWPNRVTITITERTAVGVLAGADGRWWAVDADGRLLEQLPDGGGGVAIEGAGGEDDAALQPGIELAGDGRSAILVATLLPGEIRAVTAAVVLGDDDDLALRLAGDGAGEVRLGPPRELADKLLAVATVLRTVDPACVAVLDVRVPTAPVLTSVRRCG